MSRQQSLNRLSSAEAEKFRNELLSYAHRFVEAVAAPDGHWRIKGFIDSARRIYPMSDDTKVLSKALEIMLLPLVYQFAEENDYQLILSREQNHYPDVSFVRKETRIALDMKSTYRRSKRSESTAGFTLGAFTGYFRDRESKKNITFPYNSYAGHFVLGIIYTRCGEPPDWRRTYSLDELEQILSVAKDFEIVLHEKYRIASDRPGSGNTKNIGSCTKLEVLRNGTGPFASLGIEVFDDYWQYYMTADMARQQDLRVPPYRNLEEYLRYKSLPGSKEPR